MRTTIKVKTKAKEEKVIKTGENSFEVWVKQVPEKGKANTAVLKALAKYFKIPQNSVKIIAGKANSSKVVEISFAR